MKAFEKGEEKEVLWEDKKRYFGLPMSFTKYSVDAERLYVEAGFLRSEINEILLYRILDIKSSVSLWQRIFGVGTVTLYNADKTHDIIRLENIKDPHSVRRSMSNLVEEQRKKNGVAGREIVGSNSFGDSN